VLASLLGKTPSILLEVTETAAAAAESARRRRRVLLACSRRSPLHTPAPPPPLLPSPQVLSLISATRGTGSSSANGSTAFSANGSETRNQRPGAGRGRVILTGELRSAEIGGGARVLVGNLQVAGRHETFGVRRRSRPRWKSTSRRPARNIWGAFARVAHAGLSSWGAGSPVCSFGSRASSALRSQNGHRSLALKKRQFLAFLQSPAGCSARGRDGVTSHRARTMRPPSVVLRTANSASRSRYCLCTACLEEELEVKMELIRRRRAR
jgi:hypothetical protein